MTTRWAAPVLALGLASLVAAPAFGGYFGITNYSTHSPPACCAQTHFLTAYKDQVVQTAATLNNKTATDEDAGNEIGGVRSALATNGERTSQHVRETVIRPYPEIVMKAIEETVTRPVYEIIPHWIAETTYTPVIETVMRESKSTTYETVTETQYREYSVNYCKKICEAIPQKQRFQVCKQVYETLTRESSRPVCKPVMEVLYRDSIKKVCIPVTENAVREVARVEFREETATIIRDVSKTIDVPYTYNRTVTTILPDTVSESVLIPGKLVFKSVPKYECSFDPCTCTAIQKQTGCVRRLVREPDRTATRVVNSEKLVVQHVPETGYVQKTIVEKVPTQVTRKIPVVVYDKVPVAVTRNVAATQVEKVPYTITRMVSTVEVSQIPYTFKKQVLGAYVETAALTPEAAAAASGKQYISGGVAAIASRDAKTYEQGGPDRVFVEGIIGTRTVTEYATKSVPVTEICRAPFRVTIHVPHETIQLIPTSVTRLVPKTTTRIVSVPTCRLVTERVEKLVPTKVIMMRSEVVTKCLPTEPSCREMSGSSLQPASGCQTGLSPSSMVAPCGTAFCCPPNLCRSEIGRPHPIRDFFARLWPKRASRSCCPSSPCSSCSAVPLPQIPPAPNLKPIPEAPPSKPTGESGPPKVLPPVSDS